MKPTIADTPSERCLNYDWKAEADSLRKELDHTRQLLGKLDAENERFAWALEWYANAGEFAHDRVVEHAWRARKALGRE